MLAVSYQFNPKSVMYFCERACGNTGGPLMIPLVGRVYVCKKDVCEYDADDTTLTIDYYREPVVLRTFKQEPFNIPVMWRAERIMKEDI